MARAGARVENDTEIVRLPPELVTEAITTAPKVVHLHRADGEVLVVGGQSRHYGSIVTDPYILDYNEGPRRPRLSDIVRLVYEENQSSHPAWGCLAAD